MKINLYGIPQKAIQGRPSSTDKGKADFSAVLERALAKEPGPVVSQGPNNLALPLETKQLTHQVLDLLEALARDPSEESLICLEKYSQALADQALKLEPSKAREVIEEVALTGVVEATKWRIGRYH